MRKNIGNWAFDPNDLVGEEEIMKLAARHDRSPLKAQEIRPIINEKFEIPKGVKEAVGCTLKSINEKCVADIGKIDELISEEEVKEIIERARDSESTITVDDLKSVAAKPLQIAANSGQRQALQNMKDILPKDPFAAVMRNPALLADGYKARLFYQSFGIFPAIQIRDNVLDKDTSLFFKSIVTALAETTPGAFIELYSKEQNLAKSGLNPRVGADFANTAMIIAPLFLVRNYLTWIGVNTDKEHYKELGIEGNLEALFAKAGFGFTLGIFGAPFDTLATNIAKIEKSNEGDIIENALRCYVEGLEKTTFREVKNGVVYRGAGNSLAALILSKEAREGVIKVFQALYSAVGEMLDMQLYSEQSKSDPRSSIAPDEHRKVTEAKDKVK
ncbi:MAG: hypothetical protein KGQ36_01645 [Rickettsiales bacterium]|nr:hypothetical protein [Rickettsiales bacterium]